MPLTLGQKMLGHKLEVSIRHSPSPRSDSDTATLIWRVTELNCTDVNYVMLVNLRA